MIIQKEIRDLIKDISNKYNIPFESAREIVYSQFKFIKATIESADKGDLDSFKNIQLRFLGTFHVSEKKAELLKDKFEKSDIVNEEHN